MRPARAVALGLAGILLAVAFAMGALALVRGGLDARSDVDDFPALVPSRTLPPVTASPSPSSVGSPQDEDDDDGQATTSPSTTPSRSATPTDDGRDDGADREGPGDDD